MKLRLLLPVLLLLWRPGLSGPALHAGELHYDVYVSDSSSFCVTSTFIYGAHEGIVVDALYRASDARTFANTVAASGREIKAIFITHPHDDHYIGLDIWKERFPNAQILMSRAGAQEFRRFAMKYFHYVKANFPAETPDTLPTPDVLVQPYLTVDGDTIRIISDAQGDEWIPSNSYLWIPSTRTIVAGDMAFSGVHVWLANSTLKSRSAWVHALDQMKELHPEHLIAGHIGNALVTDDVSAIERTQDYIRSFDEVVEAAKNSDDLVERMAALYPGLRLKNILLRAARIAIPDL